jgi:hypothetical protein
LVEASNILFTPKPLDQLLATIPTAPAFSSAAASWRLLKPVFAILFLQASV